MAEHGRDLGAHQLVQQQPDALGVQSGQLPPQVGSPVGGNGGRRRPAGAPARDESAQQRRLVAGADAAQVDPQRQQQCPVRSGQGGVEQGEPVGVGELTDAVAVAAGDLGVTETTGHRTAPGPQAPAERLRGQPARATAADQGVDERVGGGVGGLPR